MLAFFKTNLSNMHVQESGNIADSNFAIFDELTDSSSIGDIDFAESASVFIISFHNFLGICDNVAGNVDVVLLSFRFTSGLLRRYRTTVSAMSPEPKRRIFLWFCI